MTVSKKQKQADVDVLPTYERTQHNTIEERVGKGGKRKRVVVDGTALDYYIRNGIITKEQYAVGLRLYTLWRIAGLEKNITMKWNLLPSGNNYEGSDRSAIARNDLMILSREMGQEIFKVVENVCCYNMMATEWAVITGRSKRSAIDILRFCLDALENSFSRLSDLRKEQKINDKN
tara:strand:+ start:693 stop:1220 length:528 start_codon:yes stop_codon:yes gene_type:complete